MNDEKNYHCQICERRIKCKFGVIAHHGYTRPGWGEQTQSCMGARNLPYEKSRDLIPKAINQIDNFIKFTSELIEKTKVSNEPMLGYRNQLINFGNPGYTSTKESYIQDLEWKIKSSTRDRDRLMKRYNDWIKME